MSLWLVCFGVKCPSGWCALGVKRPSGWCALGSNVPRVGVLWGQRYSSNNTGSLVSPLIHHVDVLLLVMLTLGT